MAGHRHLLTRLIAGLCGLLALPGCPDTPPGGGPPDAAPRVSHPPKGARVVTGIEAGTPGGELVLTLASSPTILNPLTVKDASSAEVVQLALFSPCWDYDYIAQAGGPGLCSAVERSEDRLQYTFTLREGVKWSDGTPITADDAVFTHQAIFHPKLPSHLRAVFQQGMDAEGRPQYVSIEKVDDRRFRYTLKRPIPQFEVVASAVRFIPKARWAKALADGTLASAMSPADDPKSFVTSGPFTLAAYEPGGRLRLTRNPYFWQVDAQGTALPYLDGVTYAITPDPNSAFMMFREGRVDLYDVRNEFVGLLEREAPRRGYVIESLGPALSTHYLMFNLDPRPDDKGQPRLDPTRRGWFEATAFRKAVSSALDRQAMVRIALQGRGQPLYSFISPGNTRWRGGEVVRYPLDRAKSVAAFESLGMRRAGEGPLTDAEGHPVAFTLLTNAENATRVQLANLIKDDLAKVGITVSIRPLPFNELLPRIIHRRDYEAVLLGWGSSVPPEPTLFKDVFLSSGGNHLWDPSQATPRRPWEAEMNTLIQAASTGLDFKARKAALDRLMHIFSDQLPQIMLVVEEEHAAAQRRIGNFRPSPLQPKTHWNLPQLYLKTP